MVVDIMVTFILVLKDYEKRGLEREWNNWWLHGIPFGLFLSSWGSSQFVPIFNSDVAVLIFYDWYKIYGYIVTMK